MAKNTNKTIIFVREPGIDVPEAYLRKVLAACPSGGGYAIQSLNDKGEPELITDNMDTSVVLSDVQDLLKSAASHRVLFAFNKLEKMDEKFLQPFHVAIDGDDVLLSFGIDGHFPTMIEADSTEESLLAHRVMFPNIQKLIKYSAGDLDKFLAELRDPTFVDMVMSRIGDRGAFCFLPPVGEAIWLGKNTAGSAFPWGQTSDTLGYTEVPATGAVTSAAADKKKGWWGKSKGPEVPVAQEAQPSVPAAPAAPPSPGPLNVPAETKPDTRIVPEEVPSSPGPGPTEPPPMVRKEVPKGISKDQRKKFIRRVTNCGAVLPDGWSVDPFYYWEVQYSKDDKMVQLAQSNKVIKGAEPKDMKHAAPKLAPTSGGEVDVLLMTKEEMGAMETHILNVLGFNAKNPKSPMEIQKMETAPKFSQHFGIDFKVLNGWTPKQLRLLGPKGLLHYALEARRQLIEASASGTTDGTVTTDVEPASPAAQSSAPTQKKGYWGKQKVA